MGKTAPMHPKFSPLAMARQLKAPFWLGLVLFLGYLSLGSNFFPTHYDWTTLFTCSTVERTLLIPDQFQRSNGLVISHIFQTPFYCHVGKCLAFFNYHGRMLLPLELLNLFFASLALLFFYLTLLKLSMEPISAFLSSAFLGFGYGFWYWSGQTYGYNISSFFVFLSLFLYLSFPGIKGILLAGVSSSLAVGFATLSFPFIGIMLLLILCKPVAVRTRFIFVFAYILTIFISFQFFLSFLMDYSFSPDLIYFSTANLFRTAHDAFLDLNQQLFRNGLLRTFKWNFLPGLMELSCPEGSIIYDHSLAAMRLNETMNRTILGAILMIIFLGLLYFKRLWALKKAIVLIFLPWIVFFGFSFMLIDPFNNFVNITFAGVIFLICAACTVSKVNRIILTVALGILFWGNFHQVLTGHSRDPVMVASENIAGIIHQGDYYLMRLDPADAEWALMYYYLLEGLPMDEKETQALFNGCLTDSLADKIKYILAKDKYVFFNLTRFERNMRLRGFTVVPGWWKYLGSTFEVSTAFVFPYHDSFFKHVLICPVTNQSSTPYSGIALEDLVNRGAFDNEIIYETYLAIRSRGEGGKGLKNEQK
ncbi:MAG: hypothetical protein V2A78_12470 [bacterium]